MSAYLLDADVVIDFLKGARPSTSFLSSLDTAGHDLLLTPVTAAEVFAGTEVWARASVATTLARFTFVDMTVEIGRKAGEYRKDFSRVGISLSTTDTLNAAAAVLLGAILVTRNRRHYPMTDLTVVSPS